MSTIEVSHMLGIPAFMWHVDDIISSTTAQRYMQDPSEIDWDHWLRSLFDRSQAVYHRELRKRTMTSDNNNFAKLFPILQKTLFDIDINDAQSRRVAVPVLDHGSKQAKTFVPAKALPAEVEDASYDFDPDHYMEEQDKAETEREAILKDELKDLKPPTASKH